MAGRGRSSSKVSVARGGCGETEPAEEVEGRCEEKDYAGFTPIDCANPSAESGSAGESTVPFPAAAQAQQTLSQACRMASSALPQTTQTKEFGVRRRVTIPAAVPIRNSFQLSPGSSSGNAGRPSIMRTEPSTPTRRNWPRIASHDGAPAGNRIVRSIPMSRALSIPKRLKTLAFFSICAENCRQRKRKPRVDALGTGAELGQDSTWPCRSGSPPAASSARRSGSPSFPCRGPT